MSERDRLLTLAAEIREESSRIGEVVRDAVATWDRRSEVAAQDRRTFVESTALKLHNFYTGCERIFERIAGEINGALPATPDWHFRLLQTMALDVPRLRPAVIDETLARDLVEYLRFRHLVRNIYGFELSEEKLQPLVDELPSIHRRLGDRIAGFLAELERLGESVDG